MSNLDLSRKPRLQHVFSSSQVATVEHDSGESAPAQLLSPCYIREARLQRGKVGAIVSMTPLGSSPGGEVFYVSSEESVTESEETEESFASHWTAKDP